MKTLMFEKDGLLALGVKHGDHVLDVEAAIAQFGGDAPLDDMALIEGGQSAIEALDKLVGLAAASNSEGLWLNEDELSFGPCVSRPNKIICVGLNYRKHADETNAPYPEVPILFNKFNNTLTGHRCEIAVPNATQKLDYEAELVIVIGKTTKNVANSDALQHVYGYAAANDLSARDLQMRTQQWLLGKTCDDFSPLGPYLVSADEVGDPNQLEIGTIVNGEIRQNSNTSDMIFECSEIVSYISQHMTLVPGDIILTGTPEGVVLGLPAEQQVFVKPGDEVTIRIEKLGELTNRFVADQDGPLTEWKK